MTKIKWFQLRLFRTIRRQICSIDMIDIETFTNIFRLLNHVDRSIIEKYIQGYSIKSSYRQVRSATPSPLTSVLGA